MKTVSKPVAIILLVNKDYNIHSFTMFKEYECNENSVNGLYYCSQSFVESIQSFERVFLYCFDKFCHRKGFSSSVVRIINQNCKKTSFCREEMTDYFVKFFVKCRTFNCVNVWNAKLSTKTDKEKMRKISHA